MKKCLMAAVVFIVAGCAGEPPVINGTGKLLEPPPGWVEYCQHYRDPACPE